MCDKKSVVANPVPKMSTSAGCRMPSAVTTASGSTFVTAESITSTSGRSSVGYQSFEIRMRLHPMG